MSKSCRWVSNMKISIISKKGWLSYVRVSLKQEYHIYMAQLFTIPLRDLIFLCLSLYCWYEWFLLSVFDDCWITSSTFFSLNTSIVSLTSSAVSLNPSFACSVILRELWNWQSTYTCEGINNLSEKLLLDSLLVKLLLALSWLFMCLFKRD